MNAFATGAVAGYGIAIPVGAIAILIVQVGIRSGLRTSFVAGAGAATADLLYAGLAVVGGAALAGPVGSFEEPLRVLSAIVLTVIAIVGLRRIRTSAQPVDAPMIERRNLAGIYGRFLALTLVNPATIVYFGAVIIGLGIATDMTSRQGVLFVAGAFTASLSWQSLLAGVGSVAGRRLGHGVQTMAIAFGNFLILAFAAAILVR